MDLHLDDRFLHGRILHGWAPRLGVERFVLVSGRLADAALRAHCEEAAAPRSCAFVLPAAGEDPPPEPAPGDFWLCEDLEAATWLLDRGPAPERLVLVGLRQGGEARGRDMSPSPAALRQLEALARRGLEIVTRPFPGEPETPLDLGT